MEYYDRFDLEEVPVGQINPDPCRHYGFTAVDSETGAVFTVEELAHSDEPGNLAVLVSVKEPGNEVPTEPEAALIEDSQIRAGKNLKIAMAAGVISITVAVGGFVVHRKRR